MADGYRFRMMGFPADLPLQPLGVDVSTAQRQTFIKDAAIDGTEPRPATLVPRPVPGNVKKSDLCLWWHL
jgi:hypothetical protein